MGGKTKYENDTKNYWTRSSPYDENHQDGWRTTQEGSTEKGIYPTGKTSNLHLDMSAGKGDTFRPVNAETYGNNYDSIFRKTVKNVCELCDDCDCDEATTWEELSDEG